MSEYEIVDVPKGTKSWGRSRWGHLARILDENRGKAVFVPRNGSTSKRLRSTVHTQVRRSLKSDEVIHTQESEHGITVWLDEETA